MKIKEFFALLAGVLKDWRVIVTLVVMLFFMWTANFILTYKKRPKKAKKAKEPKPEKPPKEEKKEEKSEDGSSEGGE
ncbi:MAG: hypothetical protein IKR45_03245 [Treponema sp.]|jgi:hypothetical protein|nr:hypothetical protein [Treponema sp.]